MIYIASFGGAVTGGPETLHQIAFLLNQNQFEARMIYFNPKASFVPEPYKKYNVPVAEKIVDSSENALIVPETLTYLLHKYKHIKKCIVWLSVDNYILSKPDPLIRQRMKSHRWPSVLYPLAFIVLLLRNKLHAKNFKFDSNEPIIHTYNCEYVKNYLIDNGIDEKSLVYICGHINDTFFLKSKNIDITKKENIILYNPNKGKNYTNKVIAFCKEKGMNSDFIPLKNMSPDEIADWMAKSKVYIDFGEFPGPERIPREAVMMGCNIITSRNGAAANNIDVPIPTFLKYDDKVNNLNPIYRAIFDLLEFYGDYYHYYDEYRSKTIQQKQSFYDNVRYLGNCLQ